MALALNPYATWNPPRHGVFRLDSGFLRLLKARPKPVQPHGVLITTTTTESLLALTGTGDRAAFASLYAETSSRVYGVINAVLRDEAMTQEVTQDVYLEIWRKADTFDATRGTARGWMLSIAHRRAVDRVRSEQAARNRIAKAGALDMQTPFDDVSEQVIDTDERSRVAERLSTLTDTQRQVINLAYYQGLTYREVASHLGVPEGTVKTRMRDGLIRLRAAMEFA